MNRRRFVTASTAALAMSGKTALAQGVDADTFTTPRSGVTISLGASGEAVFLPDDYRFTDLGWFTEEETWFHRDGFYMSVQVLEGNFTPELWRYEIEEMLISYHSGWAEFTGFDLDRDSGWILAQGHFYLDLIEMTYTELYQDFEEGLHIAVAVWADPDALIDNILWMQQNVAVNDHQVLVNTDVNSLDTLVKGDPANSPMPLEFPVSTIKDWESEGLTSDSEWNSYYHPAKVTWDTAVWNVPLHNPEPVYHERAGFQSGMALETEGSSARVWIHVDRDGKNLTMSERIDLYSTEDFMTNTGFEFPALDIRVKRESGSIISSKDRGYGKVTIQVREVFFLQDGEEVTFFVESTPENLPTSYSQAIDLIEINGMNVEPTWTTREIGNIAERFIPA